MPNVIPKFHQPPPQFQWTIPCMHGWNIKLNTQNPKFIPHARELLHNPLSIISSFKSCSVFSRMTMYLELGWWHWQRKVEWFGVKSKIWKDVDEATTHHNWILLELMMDYPYWILVGCSWYGYSSYGGNSQGARHDLKSLVWISFQLLILHHHNCLIQLFSTIFGFLSSKNHEKLQIHSTLQTSPSPWQQPHLSPTCRQSMHKSNVILSHFVAHQPRAWASKNKTCSTTNQFYIASFKSIGEISIVNDLEIDLNRFWHKDLGISILWEVSSYSWFNQEPCSSLEPLWWKLGQIHTQCKLQHDQCIVASSMKNCV